ncbi:MAG: response regulator [Anaerolineales bacterium]|nr:response regulator [Anaerolineales bacterium]
MTRSVLLIEDNPDHAVLIQAVLETAWPAAVRVMILSDGLQALEYVRHPAPAPVLGLPDIVLLDLKLPKVDGLEVLRALRGAAAWERVPVIVLTTSNNPADVRACYATGADAYLSKLVALNGAMRELIRSIETLLARPAGGRGQPLQFAPWGMR